MLTQTDQNSLQSAPQKSPAQIHYKNPPLVEAICAFQFVPGSVWDATVLGLVYDRIKEEFPEKRQDAGAERMQFRRSDNRALVQVGQNALTVNHLTPYCGWPEFRAMIERVLAAYREVAAPQGLEAISLRYVNRLSAPAQFAENDVSSVEIPEYLRAFPSVPESVPQTYLEWAQRVVIPFEFERLLLTVQSGTVAPSEVDRFVFLLDLEAEPFVGEVVGLEEAVVWQEKAHTTVEAVFESCLGSQARSLFG